MQERLDSPPLFPPPFLSSPLNIRRKNLQYEMDALNVAISAKISTNMNALLSKAQRGPSLSLKRNDQLAETIGPALEEMRHMLTLQHPEVMTKLGVIEAKLDEKSEQINQKLDQALANEDRVQEMLSDAQEQIRDMFKLIDKGSDSDVQKLLDVEYAKLQIAFEKIDFSKEDFLAEGDFGKVYRGRYDFQSVAIKIGQVSSKKSKDSWAQSKLAFKREIVLLGHDDMQHAHLCTMLGGTIRERPRRQVGLLLGAREREREMKSTRNSPPPSTHTAQLVYVMELYEFGSIRDYLDGNKSAMLAPETCVTILSDCSRGLAHLHSRGVCHRDVRSENLLLTMLNGGRMRIVLSDFTSSKKADEEEKKNGDILSGHANWAAPECLVGSSAAFTSDSDVYSFGCLIYEILTRVGVVKVL